METGEIGPVLPADIQEISRLHRAVLPEGFLAQLGESVLTQIYSAAFMAPGAIGLAARNGREIAGFLLAATDTRALFRHILLSRTLPLISSLIPAVARNPRVLKQCVESVRYPIRRDLGARPRAGDAELISIGILPAYQSKGYGRALILSLNREFADRGVGSYTVSVYSSNEEAKAFYRRMGFEFAHEFRMYGRAWTLYRLLLPGSSRAD